MKVTTGRRRTDCSFRTKTSRPRRNCPTRVSPTLAAGWPRYAERRSDKRTINLLGHATPFRQSLDSGTRGGGVCGRRHPVDRGQRLPGGMGDRGAVAKLDFGYRQRIALRGGHDAVAARGGAAAGGEVRGGGARVALKRRAEQICVGWGGLGSVGLGPGDAADLLFAAVQNDARLRRNRG